MSRRRAFLWLAGGSITLASVLAGDTPKTAAQEAKPAAATADVPEDIEQFMRAFAREVALEHQLPQTGQEVTPETRIINDRIRYGLFYTTSGGHSAVIFHSVGLDGTKQAAQVIVRMANIDNARELISPDEITNTLAKYFQPLPDIALESAWNQFRQASGAPTIEKVWKNEDGTLESRGAALWGENPAQGPGNFLVAASRMWPGSNVHERGSIFPR
ncbi:MAG: hypothetical protein U0821_16165 [Chloroflexota bacterium]